MRIINIFNRYLFVGGGKRVRFYSIRRTKNNCIKYIKNCCKTETPTSLHLPYRDKAFVHCFIFVFCIALHTQSILLNPSCTAQVLPCCIMHVNFYGMLLYFVTFFVSIVCRDVMLTTALNQSH